MNLEQLQPYLPKNALVFIEKWINPYPLTLKITRSRQTKLGDYRKLQPQKRHQITVNGDLNPEAFFFVFTHEIAHMMVYAKYNYGQVAPHGKEWKIMFGKLLAESIEIYPEELRIYVAKHAQSPKASVGADSNIAKFLINDSEDYQDYLEDLQIGTHFKLGQKVFQKGEKRKLRYICCDIKTNKNYLINATALVEKL